MEKKLSVTVSGLNRDDCSAEFALMAQTFAAEDIVLIHKRHFFKSFTAVFVSVTVVYYIAWKMLDSTIRIRTGDSSVFLVIIL